MSEADVDSPIIRRRKGVLESGGLDGQAICAPVEPVLMAVHRVGCEAAPQGEDVKGYPCPLCWAAGARVAAGPEALAPRPRS